MIKTLPANARDAGHAGSIPRSRRSPELGNSNRLQYSSLESPMDREAWQATVHGVQRAGHDLATEHVHMPLYQGLLRVLLITFTKISVAFNNALRDRILHNLLHTKSFSSGRTIKLFVFKACLSLGQSLCDTAQELEADSVLFHIES